MNETFTHRTPCRQTLHQCRRRCASQRPRIGTDVGRRRTDVATDISRCASSMGHDITDPNVGTDIAGDETDIGADIAAGVSPRRGHDTTGAEVGTDVGRCASSESHDATSPKCWYRCWWRRNRHWHRHPNWRSPTSPPTSADVPPQRVMSPRI